MENINFSHSDAEVKEVEMLAGFIKTQMSTMGNNNYEYSFIDQIQNDFLDGKMDAKQAMEKLRAIPESKQVGVF